MYYSVTCKTYLATLATYVCAQLFSRLRTNVEDITIPVCEDFMLKVGDVVEFSGSPKLEVLMSIVAHCILPKVVCGCEMDAIFISTDRKFDIITLVRVIEHKLKLFACSSDRTFLDSILERLHLFQASSINDCCMVLRSLLHFPLMYGKIGTVIIDDVGLLSWENKMCTKKELKLGDCIDIVKKLVQENEALYIFSQSFPLPNDGHHVKPWLKLVNYRFKLEHHSTELNTRIQQTFPDSGKSFIFNCLH